MTATALPIDDMTDELPMGELLNQARRFRRLANGMMDERTAETLNGMADEYEQDARAPQGKA